jgi:xanthine dehydrogenase YagS FAD-binding subunit
MKPFEYSRVSNVGEAVKQKDGKTNVRFLAGGSNLVDLMRYGVEGPDHLIDVTRLPLDKIEDSNGGLRVGALVRNSDLAADPRVVQRYPVLSQALLAGASPQLRNMATTGGNLLQRTRCYYFYDTAFPCNKRQPGSGCPAIPGVNRIHAILGQSENCIAVHPSDMAVAMAILDATVHTEGAKGKREIPILEFHRLPGDTPNIDTNLQPDELITHIEIPAMPMAGHSSYLKVRDRNSYAFALVSVAAALDVQGGTIKSARFALGGVAHKPWRSLDAEKALEGQPATAESFAHAADIALGGAKGYEHNTFKIELAKRSIVRAFSDLAGLAS